MAVKKIKLDFSKVEEKSGWNTRGMPEGLHKMKVESVQESAAQDGTDMLVYALRPTEGKYKTRLFPFYCKLQQNQYWKLRDLIVATGGTVPKKVGMIDPNGPVGKLIAAEVEDETGQYAGRSSVNGTYGLDVLDEDGAEEPGDDEDEEYEGDEDEADDDSDEEDEDEDSLESMSLPELKKLAKELGIKGYTKLDQDDLIEAIEEAEAEADEEDDEDEDDDDLDDEELYEDDEDEDEEEEPAPKRRAPAKAAPKPAAKKAPAKAAAAPARRTVKRR